MTVSLWLAVRKKRYNAFDLHAVHKNTTINFVLLYENHYTILNHNYSGTTGRLQPAGKSGIMVECVGAVMC